MFNPLVSIIVPCYNQAHYLDECLQSVFNQAYIDWECIIINDGSPDNTEQVAKRWIEKDSRFKYLYKENGGLSSARNYGISDAKGEFILPIDADDKISEKYIELALKEFFNDSDLKVVYCQAEKFGDEEGLWLLPRFSRITLARFNMIFCSAIFRKKDWELAKGYDINMIYGLEDWEFWIAILKNGGNVKRLDHIGFFYRIKSDSMSQMINLEQRNFSEEYVSKKHIDFINSNYDFLESKNRELMSLNVTLQNHLKSEKVLINKLFLLLFGFKIFKIKNE